MWSLPFNGGRGSSENHKKGICSDGVSQTLKTVEWPQPSGIFTDGRMFHPTIFLQVVREIYVETVMQGHPVDELSMENQAFVRLLSAQKLREGTDILFKLDCLDQTTIASAPESLFVKDSTGKLIYLRMDCLQDGCRNL